MLTVTLFLLSSLDFKGNKLKPHTPLISVWASSGLWMWKNIVSEWGTLPTWCCVCFSLWLRNLTSAVCFSMCCRLMSTTRQTLQRFYGQVLSATLWLLCALPPMTHCVPFKLQTSAEPASQTSLAAVYRFLFLHLSPFFSIRVILQQAIMSH